MREVRILGVGQVPVSKGTEATVQEMAARAAGKALEDAEIDRVDALYVGNMLSGILSNQQVLAPLIAETLGQSGIEAYTHEAGCASGGAALRHGFMAVAGGFADTALVVGTEKMTHTSLEETSRALATASNWPNEGAQGETFLTLNAKLMSIYMERYAVKADDFSPFAVTAHQNALSNPNALLHKKIDKYAYVNSRPLVNPLRLFDASPVCDGAAAVIIGAGDRKRKDAAIRISASAMGTDSVGIYQRKDAINFRAIKDSTYRALTQAGIPHSNIDIFEAHDAYTVISALSLECAGFALPGTAIHMAEQGEIALDGNLPMSTMGGLKSRGHPVGATGIYQVVEVVGQLAEEAGENQVQNARVVMTQNIGGSGAVVVTHILERTS